MKKLERRIEAIKKELMELGEMRPGALSEQFNVCGTPNCRCKDPVKPQRHGPYYQISFTRGGRSKTEFVKKENLEEVREQLANFKTFKALTEEWVELSLEIAKLKKEARAAVKA